MLITSNRAVLLLLLIFPLTLQAQWQTLDDCRLIDNPANDGDSFHVMADREERIFRLYFVDCPESEAGGLVTERIKQQAAEFGITEVAVIETGKKAAAFTQAVLSRPFTVTTRGQNALGHSKLPREYAFITTADGDLGEMLLERGLARSHGQAASLPGQTAKALWQKYDRAQANAKTAKMGAWGKEASLTTLPLTE